jgi:GNAT superfamily N-acetyltransferase
MGRPGALALLAFVADGREGIVIGEAIQVIAPGSVHCEIALSITDDWQRRGLGTRLLRRNGMPRTHARRALSRRRRLAHQRRDEVPRPQTRVFGDGPGNRRTAGRIVKDLSVPHSGPPCREQFAPPSIAV